MGMKTYNRAVYISGPELCNRLDAWAKKFFNKKDISAGSYYSEENDCWLVWLRNMDAKCERKFFALYNLFGEDLYDALDDWPKTPQENAELPYNVSIGVATMILQDFVVGNAYCVDDGVLFLPKPDRVSGGQ